MRMFEALTARAERRTRERAAATAQRIAEAAPEGLSVSVEEDRVVLSGRGLGQRSIEDPAMRWLAAEARNG